MKVLISCGHNKSLQTIALINLLLQNNISVCGVIQSTPYSLNKLRYYFRLYGTKNFYEKVMVHYFNSNTRKISNEIKVVQDFLKKNKIIDRYVSTCCKKNKIPFCKVNTFSDKKATEFCNLINADLLIYSGGGILRSNLISCFQMGVINAHSGYLPFFRGMNAIEWSILHKIKPYTTLHLIDHGIDTGDIIMREEIPFSKDIYEIRGNAIVHNIKLILEFCKNHELYLENKTSQYKYEGRQFYVMHDKIKEIISDFNFEQLNDPNINFQF